MRTHRSCGGGTRPGFWDWPRGSTSPAPSSSRAGRECARGDQLRACGRAYLGRHVNDETLGFSEMSYVWCNGENPQSWSAVQLTRCDAICRRVTAWNALSRSTANVRVARSDERWVRRSATAKEAASARLSIW
eukprot:7391963-Prymnesium_polylepis.3